MSDGALPRILVVEDNVMNQEMLSRRLVRRGFEVLVAENGQEALDAVRSATPDLVLMDMSLPVIDGYAATAELKADPATKAVPVIALTAHAMAGDEQRCLDVGCDAYEQKPMDLERLVGKIHALLDRP